MSGSSLRTLRLLLLRLLSALLGALLGGFLCNFFLSHEMSPRRATQMRSRLLDRARMGAITVAFTCSDSAPYTVRYQFAIFFLLAAIRDAHAQRGADGRR